VKTSGTGDTGLCRNEMLYIMAVLLALEL